MQKYESLTSYPTICIYSGDGGPWFILEFGAGPISLIMLSSHNHIIKSIITFLIILVEI